MTLTDAGPLVALLDVDDLHHAGCLAVARQLPSGPLVLIWPCFTEAMYLLGDVGGYRYQSSLWALKTSGKLILLDLTVDEALYMEVLMERYHDLPMDLADASLIAVADLRSLRRVFSLDRDFYIYRLSDGSAMEVIR